MKTFRENAGPISALLVFALMMLQFPMGMARASMISTERLLEASEIERERARIRQFLTREDVEAKMISLGVDPAEARSRVNALSDQEVRQVAAKIDTLPAGQGDAGTIVAVILIAFLVLVITDLAGATNVFPFIRPINRR